jgi:hypothetical protein
MQVKFLRNMDITHDGCTTTPVKEGDVVNVSEELGGALLRGKDAVTAKVEQKEVPTAPDNKDKGQSRKTKHA